MMMHSLLANLAHNECTEFLVASILIVKKRAMLVNMLACTHVYSLFRESNQKDRLVAIFLKSYQCNFNVFCVKQLTIVFLAEAFWTETFLQRSLFWLVNLLDRKK